ncbi:hypothetical protein ACGFIP_32340 [Micromonospora zamorensis]|uniref:hypothetical protein n=1 Tax=Micromonospora zamorensis TaxID=709883 RepID=UPI00371F5090
MALAAAAALTSKGEFDLAVMVHYPWYLAPLFPLALDVYLATAGALKSRADVAISLLLMIGAQVAVHLTDHFISEGEQVPWGLILGVSCIPPIVAWRAKSLASRHQAAVDAAVEAERQMEEAARAAVAAAEQSRAEAEARLVEERAAREADARAAAGQLREHQATAAAQLRDEQTAREAAEHAARVANERADRAALRADRARTERDRDAAARRSQPKPAAEPVTQHGGQSDAPETPSVTHSDDASPRPGDASGDAPAGGKGDAPLTREQRLTLAVMEVVEGKGSARAAALSHDVDPQAVQRRVRAARAEAGTQQPRPLARPAGDGAEPTQHSTT